MVVTFCMCIQQGEVLPGGELGASQKQHPTGQNKSAGEESDESHRAAAARYHRSTLQKPNKHASWYPGSRCTSSFVILTRLLSVIQLGLGLVSVQCFVC